MYCSQRQFNKKLKAKDVELARARSDKFRLERKYDKKVNILEDHVSNLQDYQELTEEDIQFTVDKAV